MTPVELIKLSANMISRTAKIRKRKVKITVVFRRYLDISPICINFALL